MSIALILISALWPQRHNPVWNMSREQQQRMVAEILHVIGSKKKKVRVLKLYSLKRKLRKDVTPVILYVKHCCREKLNSCPCARSGVGKRYIKKVHINSSKSKFRLEIKDLLCWFVCVCSCVWFVIAAGLVWGEGLVGWVFWGSLFACFLIGRIV